MTDKKVWFISQNSSAYYAKNNDYNTCLVVINYVNISSDKICYVRICYMARYAMSI